MNTEDAKYKADAKTKVANLEKAQKRLDELGVTDNKWTNYPIEECRTLHNLLNSTLDKRNEAWVREQARFEYAVRANAFEKYFKDTEKQVNAYNFGSSLDAVQKYKAVMNADDAKIKAEVTKQMAELERTQGVLDGLGVKDNKWTTFPLDTNKAFHQQLLDTLQRRQDAWVREEARFQFAVRANAYKLYLKDSRNKINDYNFGHELDSVRAYKSKMEAEDKQYLADSEAKVADLEKSQGVLDSLVVTDNKWTTLSLKDCKDLHASLKETLAKRNAAWVAEEARLYAEFRENLRIKYGADAGDVNLFFERAKDLFDPNVVTDSIEAIKALQKRYDQFLADQVPKGRSDYEALLKLADQLTLHKITDFSGFPKDLVEKRYQEMLQQSETHKQALK
jgi:hypothetical protein